MIIILSDVPDQALTATAQTAGTNNAAVFGLIYNLGNAIPALVKTENLFILAHGAAVGDQGIPVIGSQASDFYLDAASFFDNFRSIFPANYSGSIYVDACQSGDSFALKGGIVCPSFATSLSVRVRNIRVYGRHGNVQGGMLLPGDPAWVQG